MSCAAIVYELNVVVIDIFVHSADINPDAFMALRNAVS
nr:MAG TPA: hypothetical protein [Caudoviricetes sp.]